VHPGDNALGRRLGPPDSFSLVPLILRWMALIIPQAQAIRWPRGLVGGRRVLDGERTGRVRFGRRFIKIYWGSDSNGEISNDLRGKPFSRTSVFENPFGLPPGPRVVAGSRFSKTFLVSFFSERPGGDGFRERLGASGAREARLRLSGRMTHSKMLRFGVRPTSRGNDTGLCGPPGPYKIPAGS
jgi:hypothetical protein